MNSPHKSSEKYALLKERGATPTEIFKECKADGHKNWECQTLLMGLFDMTLDATRPIAHAEHFAKIKKMTNDVLPNHALNLAPFGRWTLRDKAAQRRLA